MTKGFKYVIFLISLVIFLSSIILVSSQEQQLAFTEDDWDNRVFDCTLSICGSQVNTCFNSCEQASIIPGDPSASSFLLRLSSLDMVSLDKCQQTCTAQYVSCASSCSGSEKFETTFGCKESEVRDDGCCHGYMAIQGNNKTDICVLSSDELELFDVKISFQKKVLHLDGVDSITVNFQFFVKDETGEIIPAKNVKIPSLFARSDNTAYIGSILGQTTFSIKSLNGFEDGYTDDVGYYKAVIVADNIALGDDVEKISEVNVYIQTSLDEENKEIFFKLVLPEISIIKVFKTSATDPARPGAYSAYSVIINDPANLKKTIYFKTSAGSFKMGGESGSKNSFSKITTTDNQITFGWMPPKMSRRVRINQIETLRKHISKLGDDLVENPASDSSDMLKETLINRMTTKLPISGGKILSIYDRANEVSNHLDSSLKNYAQMSDDYYNMFDEDATLTESIVRATLMTEGAYEITDGAITVATGSDNNIKDVIKQRGLEAFKESLRNELLILEAAKGKEYYKYFPLYVKVVAGGSTASSQVTLTAKAPIIIYEGSDIRGDD